MFFFSRVRPRILSFLNHFQLFSFPFVEPKSVPMCLSVSQVIFSLLCRFFFKTVSIYKARIIYTGARLYIAEAGKAENNLELHIEIHTGWVRYVTSYVTFDFYIHKTVRRPPQKLNWEAKDPNRKNIADEGRAKRRKNEKSSIECVFGWWKNAFFLRLWANMTWKLEDISLVWIN